MENALTTYDERKPKKWKPVYDRMCMLRVLNYTMEEIATSLDYTPERVYHILATKRAKREMQKMAEGLRQRTLANIEERLTSLGTRAVENIAKTIEYDIPVGSRAKKHQDNVSFELLSRIGFGKSDKEQKDDGGIKLDRDLQERMVTALEKSDEARRIYEIEAQIVGGE